MNRSLTTLLLLLSLAQPALAQRALPSWLARPDTPADTAGLGRVLARPDFYRLQVSLVRVRRDAQGRPHLSRPQTYRLQPKEYFYPASTVKLAGAVFALEKLERLQRTTPALTADSPMRTDTAFQKQTPAWVDSSADNRRASLGHYIHKMLIVSDNDAYNRLYEFVGPEELNAGLRRLGLRRARLTHRLSVGDGEPRWRHTNPIRFFADTAGRQLVYAQPAAYWTAPRPAPGVEPASMLLGTAYIGGQDQRIDKPLDLSDKNVFSLPDLQQLLRAVVLPETVPAARRPQLSPAGYERLRLSLSQLPPRSRSPRYDSLHYPSTYCKFLFGGGGTTRLPAGVRVFNKIGQAYGFLIDNAYVVDAAHGVEFLLAAVVYVNADGVLNDDRYDYDKVGFPFLRDLGLRVYEAELRRRAARQPKSTDAKSPR